MAAIRKSDVRKMSPREMQAKLVELERTLLELQGEGKHEKKKPVKKAIACLKTMLHMKELGAGKSLNTTSAPKEVPRRA